MLPARRNTGQLCLELLPQMLKAVERWPNTRPALPSRGRRVDRRWFVLCWASHTTDERVQIDAHWLLSGVHFIMMVNSAQPSVGGGVGCTPSLFHSISRAKLCCRLQFIGADTLLLFLLYLFLLCGPYLLPWRTIPPALPWSCSATSFWQSPAATAAAGIQYY